MKKPLKAFQILIYGLVLFIIACGGGAGGGGEETDSNSSEVFPIQEIAAENENSLTDEEFFQRKIWEPVMSQSCITCHNDQGLAKDTRLVLQNENQQDFLNINLLTLTEVAILEENGTSLLLLKPSNQTSHFGGEQIKIESEDYQNFEELVRRLTESENGAISATDPSSLNSQTQESTSTFSETARLILQTDLETLRKATFSLAGRLPTLEEEEQVNQEGEAGLDTVLDQILTEESFYDRLKEIYNDLLLTDRYIYYGSEVLSEDDYPEKSWFDKFETIDEEKWEQLREYTHYGVGREPLALIAHVVRENRPFTEILTADYMMVTPYSARSYGIEEGHFQDTDDPNQVDFRQFYEAHLPGTPHAGILTSFMFLDRYPTTDSNRNRRRSRMVYKAFLGTDILQLAQQPVDTTLIVDGNPTLTNPQCTVCHSIVDPIAGSFQNWNNPGDIRYEIADWFEDMRLPGFNETELMPVSAYSQSLQWLAQRIAEDPRFAKSAVIVIYRGFTGKELLTLPSSSDSDYATLLNAYQEQIAFFDSLAQQFINSNYDLKEVVKGVITSTYFRAKNVSTMVEEEDARFAEAGMARLLTPEELDRKIEAVTGYPWENWGGDRHLLKEWRYRLLYGGIDSDTITERMTEPSGIIAAVQQRMAYEMACVAIPYDFTILDQNKRLLLPFVERSTEPETRSREKISRNITAIKNNLQSLYKRVLGEELALDDPEIERIYTLFLETWREGKQGVTTGKYDEWLPWDCDAYEYYHTDNPLPEEQQVVNDENYIVRSWTAVMTYLLLDFEFLYE